MSGRVITRSRVLTEAVSVSAAARISSSSISKTITSNAYPSTSVSAKTLQTRRCLSTTNSQEDQHHQQKQSFPSRSQTQQQYHQRQCLLLGTSMTKSFASQSSMLRRSSKILDMLQRRMFSTTSQREHGHIDPPKPGEELHVTFIDKDGSEHSFEVAKGDNLLDIAQANDLEMEGACGGSCACSTCHVIVQDPDLYDKMSEPDDDENDMLDLAFGLTETSRLGCQVKMDKDIDGLVVKLPSMTRNLQASDFKNKS